MSARQARYVVQKAPGIDGPPIPAAEPCIVIRGQDALALATIEVYLAMYAASAEHVDRQVIDELRQHRDAIEAWQREHTPKWADR